MKLDFFSVATANHIAVVTIDRPPVNAANRQFFEEITRVFDSLGADGDVHVIVLIGAGRVFCAGADLKDPSRGKNAAADESRLRAASNAFFAILNCKKPTIAAVNGPAIGAGLVVVSSCDILIASQDAFFSLPETALGLLGGGRHVMRLFGHSRSRRMMLSGYRVDADELYRLGVVEKCVPGEQLKPEALAIAHEIACLDPRVTQLAKRTLNFTEQMTLRDGYAYEQGLTLELILQHNKAQ